MRAARLIDGRGGPPLLNAVVLIEDNRIREVGANLAVPADAKVIDLGGATLLPGLIDAHTHLLTNLEGPLELEDTLIFEAAAMTTAKRALLGAAMARAALEAGITTARDLGNSGLNGDVALRDAIRAGWVVGPRLLAATRALSPLGGQYGPGLSPAAQRVIDDEYAVVSGVEEARRAVRQAIYDGADCIKVIVDVGPRRLDVAELKAIVEEAHRVGRKVAAHAVTDPAIRWAVEAGVDSVEHGYRASDETLKLMAQRRVFLVPTDWPMELAMKAGSPLLQRTPETEAEAKGAFAESSAKTRQRLLHAHRMGVRIAFGSDDYYEVPGMSRGRASLFVLRSYAAAGLPPMEVIRSVTANAAELLGLEKMVGTIEAGKFADLVAVAGNPLEDLRLLEQVEFVMKGGKVVRSELGGRRP